VASASRYVRERNGVFYYERRVPQDILRDAASFQQYFKGSKLFRRSLRTKERGAAYAAAAETHRECERLVREARADRITPTIAPPRERLRQVTKDLISDIAAYHRLRTARPFAQAALWAEQDEEQAEYFQQMIDDRELFAQDRKRLITTRGARSRGPHEEAPLDTAEQLIETLGLDAADGSPQRGLISIAVRDGILAGENDIDRIIAGERPQLDSAPALYNQAATVGPTLRDVVERYLADVSVRPKTAHEIETSLALFEKIVGLKELSQLTRRDFTFFIEELAKKKVGGRSAESIERMIGPGTVKKRLGFLRTAINHAIEKDLYAGANPASGINIEKWVTASDKSVMPDKRPFKVSELNLIFEHPWFTGCQSAEPQARTHKPGDMRLTGAHYWAPVVALFTGCRAAELGGLKVSEIHLDDPCPHIHIRDNEHRPTKKGYARLVPILDGLFDLGFGDYVAAIRARGADRLFPDWEPPGRTGDFDKDDAAWSNASIIRAFNRTVIKHRLNGVLSPSMRREVTFHNFRSAFKSMLGLTKHRVAPNVINEVTGHSKSELDRRYVGVVPLEETYPAIRACGWDGLKIPPAPPLPT
jgi:integrase